jgi:C_GCAxxG_C_C family probable redox protein
MGRLISATLAGALLNGCFNRKKIGPTQESVEKPDGSGIGPDVSNFETELSNNRKMPRALVHRLLDQKVDQYMQRSHHCAQSSFLALKEQFGLQGEEIVKALTPVTGIAERGETCGAVTGPLMVFGLIYGRNQNQLDNWDIYRESLVPSGKFCALFEKEYGSTMCHDIQNMKFGRCFHLTNPAELKEFQESEATEHCSAVVRKAVQIAADIIIDDTTIP